MDAKITLSFDKNVIERTKAFAADNNISLSRLTEFIYRQISDKQYKSLEELPIADWVSMLHEEQVEYQKTPSRKALKSSYMESRKK